MSCAIKFKDLAVGCLFIKHEENNKNKLMINHVYKKISEDHVMLVREGEKIDMADEKDILIRNLIFQNMHPQ